MIEPVTFKNVTVLQGDLLAQDVDAIVNPANGHLNHGGGVAALIARKAAPSPIRYDDWYGRFDRLDDAVQERQGWIDDHAAAPLLATGNAYATSAGLLDFKAVIHAVGPIWNGGDYLERTLLDSAHKAALREAERLGFSSVAFPAVSCGIFGFPVEAAAPLAIKRALKSSLEVRFCLFEDEHYWAFRRALFTAQTGLTVR